MFRKDKPYNSLPLLPLKVEIETKETLKAEITVNKSIIELKGIAKTIPDEMILINTLPLHEIRSSSEIENIVTTNLFMEIYRTIKGTGTGIRKLTGTKIQSQSGKIFYTPPEGENVIRNKLKNLETFIHSEKGNIDPLIKAALIHYQFEAIHPFTDGNERTDVFLLCFILFNKQFGFTDTLFEQIHCRR